MITGLPPPRDGEDSSEEDGRFLRTQLAVPARLLLINTLQFDVKLFGPINTP